MPTTYADCEPLLPATEDEISAILLPSPRTERPIPRLPLRTWLAETNLLRFGASGTASGWLIELSEVVTAIAPVIDWLCDGLRNEGLTHLRTDTRADVAGGLEAIQAAYHAAPQGCPVPVEDIDARLLDWTGGRRFADATPQRIGELIDLHTRETALQAIRTRADAAYEAAAESFRAGDDVATFTAAAETAWSAA